MSLQAKNESWQKGLDQKLLTQHVWPRVRSLACVHDSHLCK